jgi:hypothetical protein
MVSAKRCWCRLANGWYKMMFFGNDDENAKKYGKTKWNKKIKYTQIVTKLTEQTSTKKYISKSRVHR